MANNIQRQLEQDAAKIDRFLRSAPRMMGQLAVREFVGSFRRQAFTDGAGVTHAWPKRKKADKKGRAILVKSGRLRRSIRVTSTDSDSVTVGSDVSYAQLHNEGGVLHATQNIRAHRRRRYQEDEVSAPGARKAKYVRTHIGTSDVKAHTRTLATDMPQRQFMGASKALNDEVRNYLGQGVANVMRPTQNVNISPA
jgi:phage gpG-like protein